MKNLIEISDAVQLKAHGIIRDIDIYNICRSAGVEVNLIGSVKTGLMMKHKDIDFDIYSYPLDVSVSFKVMAKLAENTSIKRIEYSNNIAEEENYIEWHLWYEDLDTGLWKIDIVHMLKGSLYDGYMEKVSDRILQLLTPELRQTILQLKYDTPEDVRIHGIEYYQAVIRDGVRTYNELKKWKENHPDAEVIKWIP
jgi:hypothetical protein